VSELNLNGFFGDTATAGNVEEEAIVEDTEEGIDPDAIEDDADAETDDEESDEESEEEDSDEESESDVDATELKRRGQQSRADTLEYQNTLLQNQIAQQNAMIQKLNQTEDDEDDFGELPDDELLTVGQQRKIKQKDAKLKRDQLKAQEATMMDQQNQTMWMKTQPDFVEVDNYYIANKPAIDQMLALEGVKSIRESYYAIRSAKNSADVTKANAEIKSLKKKTKKLKKNKGKLPPSGPGGLSPRKSSGVEINDFFNRDWNR